MRILLTRALSQVQPLQTLLSEQGYRSVLFPSLAIKPLNNIPAKNHYDALIFISVNAVEYGFEVLKNLDCQSTKIFAIGAATAKKLEQQGIQVDAFPAQNTSSEALLTMDELRSMDNQSILIFRGNGGRETLKQGLEKHNVVEYIEVYRRVPCDITALHHDALTEFLQSQEGIVTATSVENLSALMLMVEQIDAKIFDLIKRYPLIVLSQRIKAFAKSIGFNQIAVATKTSDKGLLEALTNLTKS